MTKQTDCTSQFSSHQENNESMADIGIYGYGKADKSPDRVNRQDYNSTSHRSDLIVHIEGFQNILQPKFDLSSLKLIKRWGTWG